ncbi:Glutamine synthetase PR-2 [Glycine max]|nr:Glutamine synthetase PR-2 [Glycine max]
MLHFYHIAFVSYHLEEPIESSKSSNAGFIIRAAIGDGSSLLVLLLLTGGCALWLKKKVEKAIQQNYLFVDEPLPTNKRYDAAKIFNHPDIVAEETWYVFPNIIILWILLTFSLHMLTISRNPF